MHLQGDSRAKRLQIAEVVQEGALGERGLEEGGVVTRRCKHAHTHTTHTHTHTCTYTHIHIHTRRCMHTNTHTTHTHTHTYTYTNACIHIHTFLNRSASLNILPSCTLSLPSRSSTNLSIGCSPPIIFCTNSSYLPKPYQPTYISHHHKNKTQQAPPPSPTYCSPRASSAPHNSSERCSSLTSRARNAACTCMHL